MKNKRTRDKTAQVPSDIRESAGVARKNFKAAFNEAAEKSTGAAKPKFEKLRDANLALDKASEHGTNNKEVKKSIKALAAAWRDLEIYSVTDPVAGKILHDLSLKIIKAGDNILGSGPK